MGIKIILRAQQIQRLSNIFDNAGQVVLGIMVFSPILTGFDKKSWSVILIGILLVLFCWGMSMRLAKGDI